MLRRRRRRRRVRFFVVYTFFAKRGTAIERALRTHNVVLCEATDRDISQKKKKGNPRNRGFFSRGVKHTRCLFCPPHLYPLFRHRFSSLFASSHFFPPSLSVYAGLQNADLIRDNLTPSTRSCFDELNPSRFGYPPPSQPRALSSSPSLSLFLSHPLSFFLNSVIGESFVRRGEFKIQT